MKNSITKYGHGNAPYGTGVIKKKHQIFPHNGVDNYLKTNPNKYVQSSSKTTSKFKGKGQDVQKIEKYNSLLLARSYLKNKIFFSQLIVENASITNNNSGNSTVESSTAGQELNAISRVASWLKFEQQ